MQTKPYTMGSPDSRTRRKARQKGFSSLQIRRQVPRMATEPLSKAEAFVQSAGLQTGSLSLPHSVFLAVIPGSEASQFFQRNLGPRTTAFWRTQRFLCCHLVAIPCHCRHIFQRFHNLQLNFVLDPETFRSSGCWRSSRSGHSRERLFPVSLQGSGGPAAMQAPVSHPNIFMSTPSPRAIRP